MIVSQRQKSQSTENEGARLATISQTAEPADQGSQSCRWLHSNFTYKVTKFANVVGTYCVDGLEIHAFKNDVIDEFGPVSIVIRDSKA
ncbi:MAG: hypothetical protein HRU19_26955 [Pseudobacteriovorax sp.]|nr:hypothetical protein [Pseudobacteriovorax sp.]